MFLLHLRPIANSSKMSTPTVWCLWEAEMERVKNAHPFSYAEAGRNGVGSISRHELTRSYSLWEYLKDKHGLIAWPFDFFLLFSFLFLQFFLNEFNGSVYYKVRSALLSGCACNVSFRP